MIQNRWCFRNNIIELHNWITESYIFVASFPLPPFTTDQNKKNKMYFVITSPNDFYLFEFIFNLYLFILISDDTQTCIQPSAWQTVLSSRVIPRKMVDVLSCSAYPLDIRLPVTHG